MPPTNLIGSPNPEHLVGPSTIDAWQGRGHGRKVQPESPARTSSSTRSMSVSSRRWLNVLSGGILTVYAITFILFFRRSGPRDGDQFLVFHSLQYWNASLFGIAKQWTPVMCAGLSMAGEPQVPFMSLSMALSYALGPLWGVRLAATIYLALGWIGAYLYAGIWLKMSAQRSLAAALFIGNGFFVCRLGFGHFDFIPFLILPLMLWALHFGTTWPVGSRFWSKIHRVGLLAMLMGATISLAIDGSPVAIIHLLFWIGLYALILALTLRSAAPAIIFSAALCAAAVLDAGYIWPMLQAQAAFPRSTPDRFTSVLSFLWFALLPVRGKVLPANGNGHELSVFIGPVIMFMLWRYRHWLRASLPTAMRRPLLIVSIVSLVLGMGSLKALHVPIWLSPFDVLRPLPGFRSIGVTGRYWGFLALPLSLLGAAALWKFAVESPPGWRLHACLGAAVALQLGFQTETLAAHWVHSPQYRSFAAGSYFRQGPETIEYVATQERLLQGQVIAPNRGVSDCYDMDDFNRPDVGPGSALIKKVMKDGEPLAAQPMLRAQFSTWSHIRLGMNCASAGDEYPCAGAGGSRMQVGLRQAYHPFWKAAGCKTYAGVRGNLVVDCPAALVRERTIELTFDDNLSDVAARTSTRAWELWFPLTGLLLLLLSCRAKSSSLGRVDALVTV
jgi:hypothetical protein